MRKGQSTRTGVWETGISRQSWGLVLNLLLAGYFLFLQEPVLARIVAVDQAGETSMGLGLLLVGVQIVEAAGVFLKRPAVKARLGRFDGQAGWGVLAVGLIAMTHFLIGVILTINALNAFGIRMSEPDTAFLPGMLALAIFFGALLKEGILFMWFVDLVGVNLSGGRAAQYKESVLPERFKLTLREMVGDVLLVIFSAMAYTAIWEMVVSRTSFLAGDAAAWIEILGAVLFFLMIYLPLRMLSIIEITSQQIQFREKWLYWGSVLLIMVSAVLNLPGG